MTAYNYMFKIRQGDMLSPFLYVLSLQLLILKIQKQLDGIQLGTEKIKSMAVGDDLAVYINDETDYVTLQTLL